MYLQKDRHYTTIPTSKLPAGLANTVAHFVPQKLGILTNLLKPLVNLLLTPSFYLVVS